MKIKVKKLRPDALLPQKSTSGAAGFDVFALDDTTISSWNRLMLEALFDDAVLIGTVVSTGIALEIEDGFEVQVRPRSGLACKHGLIIPNSPGTIDSDYRGEVKVFFINFGPKDYAIKKGDRIAQLVISSLVPTSFVEVLDISETTRGAGGFGSTGR